jgi:hypothetical protein
MIPPTPRWTLAVAFCALSLCTLSAATACTNGNGNDDTSDPYCSPTLVAGDDLSITLGNPITLSVLEAGYGAGCQQQHTYTVQWRFDATPPGSLVDETALSDNGTETALETIFLPDTVGTYVVSVQACDDNSCSETDIIVATVSHGDAAPNADAGEDIEVAVDERAQLDGTGSDDPEGADLTYTWALTEVPDCSALGSDSIYNQGSATPTVVPDCEGLYLASLVVSDGLQWSDPDYVSITALTGNRAPIADAGDALALPPCDGYEAVLDGFGSYDPDGDLLTYEWSLLAAPKNSVTSDASFDDMSLANPTFTWDEVGDYTFQLQVFDGEFWSAPDLVTWEMVGLEKNKRPVANAGENESSTMSVDCTTADYEFTCDPCEPSDFDLDGSGSYDPDGDEIRFNWSDETGELTIESPYSARTVAWTPEVEADNGDTTMSWELNLDVSDCDRSDYDTVTLTFTCTGSL